MSDEMMRQEVREAIGAGARALTSLKMAREKLESAKTWGIVDLLGGAFFTDMVKHTKMQEAVTCMEVAKTELLRFQKELGDVQVPIELRMEVDRFLSFADFFFDGIVADYLVQKKIREAREQVEDAIYHVENLMEDLKQIREPF